MDFTLSPEIEDLRLRVRAFVEEDVLPLEADPENFSDHENIPEARLAKVREKARKAGLWAPQSPKEYGGMGLPIGAWAAIYEEAARSIFGPLAINCMAPDDGNMNLLAKTGTPEQKEKWLQPIVEGKVRSAFVMTEPHPGSGSDPGMMLTRAEKKTTVMSSLGANGSFLAPTAPRISSWLRARRTIRVAALRPFSITRTNQAGASCAASRSWGRKNTAAIASLNSTDSKFRARTSC